MAFIIRDTGGNGNYKRVPQGVFIGRCYSLIDLGTQTTTGQFGTKSQHKIRIGWELFGEDETGAPLTVDVDGLELPMTIQKSYTVSMHEKAGLRRDLAAWRGRDFTDEEMKEFDIAKLLGAYCMINVTESENNGKIYSNVGGITPLPGALKNNKPEGVHDHVIFNLADPDMSVFNSFHEKLQDAIMTSPEWVKIVSKDAPPPPPAMLVPVDEFASEDIPF